MHGHPMDFFQGGGGKSSEISFNPLGTNKTTFCAEILVGKYQISKSKGCPRPHFPTTTSQARSQGGHMPPARKFQNTA